MALDTDTAPSVIAPEATAPEAIAPEATAPEAIAPEAIAPEAIAPEAIAPETIDPEAIAPEATAPEAMAPEPTLPEGATPKSRDKTKAYKHPSSKERLSSLIGPGCQDPNPNLHSPGGFPTPSGSQPRNEPMPKRCKIDKTQEPAMSSNDLRNSSMGQTLYNSFGCH
jgi:hypothetical protein